MLPNALQNDDLRYKIFHTTGSLIIAGQLAGTRMNCSALPSGVYYLLLENDRGQKARTKFMKVH